jgi:hypothetical protein
MFSNISVCLYNIMCMKMLIALTNFAHVVMLAAYISALLPL